MNAHIATDRTHFGSIEFVNHFLVNKFLAGNANSNTHTHITQTYSIDIDAKKTCDWKCVVPQTSI